MTKETKQCKSCKTEFAITPDDLTFYEKVQVPAPTWCPECRKQRRLSWRNNINLYPRNCDMCKKRIVSIYATNKPMPVYCNSCWWSNKWDPMEYGTDYDFSKPFFEQFNKLQSRVPYMATVNDNGL